MQRGERFGLLRLQLGYWSCWKDSIIEGLFEQLSSLCSEVNGLLTVEPRDSGWIYSCQPAA